MHSTKSLVVAFLPLLLALIWPRAYGPSLDVSPFLMGVLSAGFLGLVIRPNLSAWALAWVLGIVFILWASPWSNVLLIQAALLSAICAWVMLGAGKKSANIPALAEFFATTIVVAAAINSLVAWLQFFDLESTLYPLTSQAGRRPFGNLRQGSHMATQCVMAVASLWWLHTKHAKPKWLLLLVAQLIISAFVLPASRTGWISMALMSLFIVLQRSKDHKFCDIYFGLSIIWAVIWLSISSYIASALQVESISVTRGMSSVASRFVLWKDAWALVLMNPLHGVGWGEFRYARFMTLPIVPGGEHADNAHNLILHLLAEIGFAGTFLILVPMIVLFWRKKPWSTTAPSMVHWAMLVILSIGVHSLLEYPLWYMSFFLPFVFACGIVLAPPSATQVRVVNHGRYMSTAIPIFLIVVSIGAFLDFTKIGRAYENERFNGDEAAFQRAQSTLFFGSYAHRLILDRFPVTSGNAEQINAIVLRNLHTGPHPIYMWAGIAAACELGNRYQAQDLVIRFKLAFPKAYDVFVENSPVTILQDCIGDAVKDNHLP